MEIIVHDTPRAMLALAELPPERRADALRDMLAPMRGAVPVPGDIVDLHHQGGGFRVDRDDDRYLPALRRLVAEDVRGQIEAALAGAWKHLSGAVPGVKGPDTLQVMLVLGDPGNDYLMDVAGGYYGMGGAPGWLYLLAWPSDEVIGRIAHCAVHEFHHQVRYHNVEWNPVTVTVGEHVVAEGLAEAFVRELGGTEAMGPWSAMVTGSEFDRAYEKIVADAGLAGMAHTPAYVLGDTAARRFGQEPVGVPDMAGYGVGLRIVDAHLAASGLTAAQSSVLPGAEILRSAGVQPGETKPDS
ncbi:DUF2268 domain-containing protein [Planomonospora venezuelensis]|uniref:Uncharacterized protein YjaZ n=1 Tax=Planomonospora venezuelensis TaxID=1999 RepID=A0A841DD19_PLAVE|nr:DUF2268 domain-containing putative Zn-dependent protease [Planomonospora venezuelensis]MBB5966188.1 uncharacterized protein YjaZ [Planomonospora venezuelensis]GIN01965.1 hypothetical protein Pve01_36230 [Planomonospora venezuelensis]